MTRFAAAAVALAFLPLPVAAADAPSTPAADTATVLHLSEQAERMVERDRLRAVLRVDATDADPTRLQTEINQRMTAAVARAKRVAGVTRLTSGYSVFQEHPRDQPPRWHGMANLTLTAHDAAPLLALVGDLQQNGLVMSSLAYELSPEAARAAEDALTEEALAHLRQRAERVAQGLGLAVVRIRDLHLGNAAAAPPVPHPMMLARTAASAAAPPVAEPGEATVSVSVEADLELGLKK